MAKMIKCPTCQTQIEVPATLTGQVVKCPGCGKGLKLVAKKKDPAAGGAGIQLSASGSPINPNSSVSGGSMAGTMAGGSISAMSFHDEPPPQDDLPNLDTNCQVCGRPTPFDELTEDNGKLVCRDCIKGARSSIARAAGGAETIGFKAPDYRPTRRAKMINVTPGFLAAVFLALVWIGCQTFLSFNPKPVGKGTAQAHAVKGKPGTPGDLSKPPTTMASATTAPMTSAELHAAATQPAPGESPSPGTAVAGTQPSETGVPTTQGVALVPPKPDGGTIFNDNGTPGVAPGVPPTNPDQPVIPPPSPAPAIVASGDPLEAGLDRLQARDYQAAIRDFESARRKYPVGGVNERITPQQALALTGLGAAYLGAGHPELAETARGEGPLGAAYARGDRSRALVLNRAIAALAGKGSTLERLGSIAADLKAYLDAHPNDEYAADVFGTLVGRASTYPKAKPEQISALWEQLDRYNDAMSAAHEGKLKWGTEWLPAEDVKRYRQARGAPAKVSLVQVAKDLETAKARTAGARAALDNAKAIQATGRAVDLVGLQNALDSAKVNEEKAQKAFDAAAAGTSSKPLKWLDKFEPAVPEAALPGT